MGGVIDTLKMAGDRFEMAARVSTVDPAIEDAVRSLCERSGYGAVMSTASALWHEMLDDGIKGGEFGLICRSTAEAMVARIDAALARDDGAVSAGHTPGPWQWDAGIIPPDGPGRYADIYVLDEDREPIILAEFNDNIPEGRANALVMVAAPDLLAALVEAEKHFGPFADITINGQHDPDDVRVVALIRAAILKAEGDGEAGGVGDV